MVDPILDEIWRVRAELIKKHGGPDGYFEYIRKRDEARRKKLRKRKRGGTQKLKPSR